MLHQFLRSEVLSRRGSQVMLWRRHVGELRLITKVWEAARWVPKCSREMRLVSLIDEEDVIDRILRDLGRGHCRKIALLKPVRPIDAPVQSIALHCGKWEPRATVLRPARGLPLVHAPLQTPRHSAWHGMPLLAPFIGKLNVDKLGQIAVAGGYCNRSDFIVGATLEVSRPAIVGA